jgi:6-phosphogluconolactonase/glucosamine-6-phosphate isomerase/deaminase
MPVATYSILSELGVAAGFQQNPKLPSTSHLWFNWSRARAEWFDHSRREWSVRASFSGRVQIARKERKVATLSVLGQQRAVRRPRPGFLWLEAATAEVPEWRSPCSLNCEVLESEDAVGQAMFEELKALGRAGEGDLVMILLGGRGAQALHKKLGRLAATSDIDGLLERLHVFTQDALAPLRQSNGFSFVRDFERLLGESFFRKVKSFTSMRTEGGDLEEGLARYVEKLESLGGIDLFFVGLGPEAEGASHIAYVKPGSGARINDMAGMIPISESILEHHISKFKAGGSSASSEDEAECRRASHILTLGPAAILGARRVVQSIVDAGTAPAKREAFKRLLETRISADPDTRNKQLDDNPGLWLRFHSNLRSLILPNVLEA